MFRWREKVRVLTKELKKLKKELLQAGFKLLDGMARASAKRLAELEAFFKSEKAKREKSLASARAKAGKRRKGETDEEHRVRLQEARNNHEKMKGEWDNWQGECSRSVTDNSTPACPCSEYCASILDWDCRAPWIDGKPTKPLPPPGLCYRAVSEADTKAIRDAPRGGPLPTILRNGGHDRQPRSAT